MYKFVELPGWKKPILKVPPEDKIVWSPERVKSAEIVSAEETWVQRQKRENRTNKMNKTMIKAY